MATDMLLLLCLLLFVILCLLGRIKIRIFSYVRSHRWRVRSQVFISQVV